MLELWWTNSDGKYSLPRSSFSACLYHSINVPTLSLFTSCSYEKFKTAKTEHLGALKENIVCFSFHLVLFYQVIALYQFNTCILISS